MEFIPSRSRTLWTAECPTPQRVARAGRQGTFQEVRVCATCCGLGQAALRPTRTAAHSKDHRTGYPADSPVPSRLTPQPLVYSNRNTPARMSNRRRATAAGSFIRKTVIVARPTGVRPRSSAASH